MPLIDIIARWLRGDIGPRAGDPSGADAPDIDFAARAADARRDYPTGVVGESHYQPALSRIAGGKQPDGHHMPVTARLVPEDDNPHDPEAVAVFIHGACVGYLSRRDARAFRARHPGTDRSVTCPAVITGGWKDGRSEGHFGVRVAVPAPAK